MPCDSAFAPLRGRQETKLFRVYLDCLVVEDIHFYIYVDHRETRPFDDIVLYSRWLSCGSRLTYPHMPESVMHQFGYMHYIPRDPFVSAPSTLTRRVMDVMFDDYLNHLVSEEAQSTIAHNDWSYVDDYIWWFFSVSHPYMILDALGDPPRPAHQKILKEELIGEDHVIDMLPKYRRIMEIVHTDIDKGIFPNGSKVRDTIDSMLAEAL